MKKEQAVLIDSEKIKDLPWILFNTEDNQEIILNLNSLNAKEELNNVPSN